MKQTKSTPEVQEVTLAEAQERVDRITSDRARLVATRISLAERLECVQKEVGAQYLRGDRSGLKEAGSISAELAAIESALGILDTHEKSAKTELQRATARDLRAQAAGKRIELEKLNAKTATLLLELGKLEDVKYTHSVLSAQPFPGSWLRWGTANEPLAFEGVHELSLNIPVKEQKMEVPLSRRIRMQIDELEARASEIEHSLA